MPRTGAVAIARALAAAALVANSAAMSRTVREWPVGGERIAVAPDTRIHIHRVHRHNGRVHRQLRVRVIDHRLRWHPLPGLGRGQVAMTGAQ